MRDFFSQLNVRISEIRNSRRKESRSEFVLEKRKVLSEREKLLVLASSTYNKKWPNGRIHGISETGEYASHSVSPYAETFLDNIEEGIKPLVLALRDKNYLSISSCEGHGLDFRRYVTLVFPDRESAQNFQNTIPFKLRYSLTHCTQMLTSTVDVDQYGRLSNLRNVDPDSNDMKRSLEYVNVMIQRTYQDAWFLEVSLSEGVRTKGLWDIIKNLRAVLKKLLFEKHTTHRLVRFVLSDKMPTNIY